MANEKKAKKRWGRRKQTLSTFKITPISSPRRTNRTTPGRRPGRLNNDHTHFVLMRKAEALGLACWCDIETKQVLIGPDPAKNPDDIVDASRAADIIEILHHKSVLNGLQYRAAKELQRLRRAAYGTAFAKISTISSAMVHEHVGAEAAHDPVPILSDEERLANQAQDYEDYHEAMQVLRDGGAAGVGIVWKVCVAGETPLLRQHDSLKRGLDDLHHLFRRNWLRRAA